MSVLIYVPGAMPSFGLDGQPVNADLQFYEAETAQPTPATVYADPSLATPHPWPLVSDSAGRFPAVYGPDDGLFRVVWSTADGQTESWDDVSGLTSADAAILAGALTAEIAAEAAKVAAEAAAAEAQQILDQILAQGGDDGWTPVLSTTVDGARIVLAITWTGGDGPAPTSGYIGSTGVVTNIANATNIRGPAGAGSGDVLQSGSITVGHLAIWAASQSIGDGGAYDWSTLPNRPTLGNAVSYDLASQAEAEAGAANNKLMSPIRVAQALAAMSSQSIPVLPKNTNFQMLQANRGALVVGTSSFVLSFDTPGNLGANWFCYLQNAGAGDITVQGTDGLTSYPSYPGEVRLFTCTGSAISSVVLKSFAKAFTASGSFIKPPGYSDFEGELWSGGGSGGSNANGPGGGGGSCVPFTLPASAFGTTTTVTIGAGGAAVTNGNGNAGGNSTLGSLLTAYGGAGGDLNNGGGGGGCFSAGSGVNGGSPRVAGADNPGHGGGDSVTTGAAKSSVYGGGGGGFANTAGNSLWGGGGGGAAFSDQFGGTSRFGGPGGRGRASLNGEDGTAPGGGGGGTMDTTKASGAGARGELRIRGVA